MSESVGINLTLLAYIIGLIPGAYFAYLIIRELFYLIKRNKDKEFE